MAVKKATNKHGTKKAAEKRTTYRAKPESARSQATRTEHPHVVVTPGYVGGKPRIAGTRIAVWLVAATHRDGWSIADMLEEWPHLNQAQLHDALSYYHDHREEIERQIYENSEEGSKKRIKETWPPEMLKYVEFERVERAPIVERIKRKHGA